MNRLRLAAHSPEFSRLIFGTWRVLKNPEAGTPQGLLERLKCCLDAGITTIDTAEIYGSYRMEEAIGAALRLDAGVKRRMEIITKAGIYVPNAFHPERRTAFYNASAERLVKSAEKSLRFLDVEVLDLFLVHRPDWLTAAEETAAGLNRLLRDGKIRSAGVSNYSPAQFQTLQRFMDQPLVTNQVEFSPFQLAPIFDGTFDQCQDRGIHPMAWSPTGGGRLFREDEAGCRLRHTLEGLAPKYDGATPDQLCHAWILAHPTKPAVVLGTTRTERIASATRSLTLSLEREDWYAITEAARGQRIP
ncbi:MAG: aldo/keto reductase [Verrucomicrobiales bacterium]|nr:aldo/keto reductase [Verrucomicrobiales bacterium]